MNAAERIAAEQEIERELLALHENSYGTGATGTSVHYVGDFVLVAFDVELTRSEETLLAAARPDAVKSMRESFQQAIEPSFVAIVERATGRRVISFISEMNIEPVYSIELFRLAPST